MIIMIEKHDKILVYVSHTEYTNFKNKQFEINSQTQNEAIQKLLRENNMLREENERLKSVEYELVQKYKRSHKYVF
jgi:cell division protein FtsB